MEEAVLVTTLAMSYQKRQPSTVCMQPQTTAKHAMMQDVCMLLVGCGAEISKKVHLSADIAAPSKWPIVALSSSPVAAAIQIRSVTGSMR